MKTPLMVTPGLVMTDMRLLAFAWTECAFKKSLFCKSVRSPRRRQMMESNVLKNRATADGNRNQSAGTVQRKNYLTYQVNTHFQITKHKYWVVEIKPVSFYTQELSFNVHSKINVHFKDQRVVVVNCAFVY